jgi:hypothetical protein
MWILLSSQQWKDTVINKNKCYISVWTDPTAHVELEINAVGRSIEFFLEKEFLFTDVLGSTDYIYKVVQI